MQVITRHQKERQMTWDIDLPSELISLSDTDQKNLPSILDQLLEALHLLHHQRQTRVRISVRRVTREHLPHSLQYYFQTRECTRLQWNLFLEASGNSPPRMSHTGHSLKTLRLIRVKQSVERAGGRLEIEEFRQDSLQIGIYLGGASEA